MSDTGFAIFDICATGTIDQLVDHLNNPLHAFSPFLVDKEGGTPIHACLYRTNAQFIDTLAKIELLKAKGVSVCAVGGPTGDVPLGYALSHAYLKKYPSTIFSTLYHPALVSYNGRGNTGGGLSILHSIIQSPWSSAYVPDIVKVTHAFLTDFINKEQLSPVFLCSIFCSTIYVGKYVPGILCDACQYTNPAIVACLLEHIRDGVPFSKFRANSVGEIAMIVDNKERETQGNPFLCALRNTRKTFARDIIQLLCQKFNKTLVHFIADIVKRNEETFVNLLFETGSVSLIRWVKTQFNHPLGTQRYAIINLPEVVNGNESPEELTYWYGMVDILQEASHFNVYFNVRLAYYQEDALPACAMWLLARAAPKFANTILKEDDRDTVLEFKESKVNRVLHRAVYRHDIPLIEACMADWLNPLITNQNDDMCLTDLTSNAELKRKLRQYSCWAPSPVQKTWWYGPFFVGRARAFLLVCNRWKTLGIRNVPRDVRHLIITHLADFEYLAFPYSTPVVEISRGRI